MKELTNRQKQAMASKRHLVETATALFNTNGYQKTTVQDICSAAGLSVGVFYHYFGSKNDMLKEIQGQKTTELFAMIDAGSKSENHMEAITELLEYLVIQQSSGEFELVRHTLNPAAGRSAMMDEKLWALMVRIVDSAQRAGELRDEDAPEEIASDLLLSARGYVFYWCEQGGDFELVPAFRGYLRRLLRGYTKKTLEE